MTLSTRHSARPGSKTKPKKSNQRRPDDKLSPRPQLPDLQPAKALQSRPSQQSSPPQLPLTAHRDNDKLLLVGLRIVEVLPMTSELLLENSWDARSWEHPLVLRLSDGSLLYAARDPELNGYGTLCHRPAEGGLNLLIAAAE